MNVRVVLMLNFLMIIIIPLLFVGILTFGNTTRAFNDEISHRLETVATMKDARIDAAIERNYERIDAMMTRRQLRLSLIAYADGDLRERDRIDATMREVLASVGDYRAVLFADTQGKVLFSTDGHPVGSTVGAESFFTQGIQGPYVSEITTDADGTPIFYLAAPVMEGERTVGTIIAVADARVLLRVADDRTGMGETGQTYLLRRTQDGTIAFITQNTFANDDPLHDLAVRTIERQWSGTADVPGEPERIAVTRYSRSTGWGMIVTTTKQEAFAPLAQMRTTFLIIVLIVVAFTVFIAWIISRSVADPVTEITRVIDDISKGRLDARIDPHLKESTDEVRDLAAAFERTIVSIKLATKRNAECVVRQEDTKDLIVLDEKHQGTTHRRS